MKLRKFENIYSDIKIAIHLIKESRNNDDIDFKLGISGSVMGLLIIIGGLLLIYNFYPNGVKDFRQIIPPICIVVFYYPYVICHELAHAVVHTRYGGFKGYIHIFVSKKERYRAIKSSSYVFKTGEYEYTKEQMIEMLLEPIKYGKLFFTINIIIFVICIPINTFINVMYLIVFLAFNYGFYIYSSISDKNMVNVVKNKKSNLVKEVIIDGEFEIE